MKTTATHTQRPPIVAVLGHVDHGKSTLLDFIRKSNVVAGEAGGITQRVAAYEVTHNDKRITFIDTPGHAAFQTIRARGASVADVAILVVAADDGVKAQTLEALQSIRDAGTPFVVAINKIDKPNANVERTQASLLEKGVYLEKLGGDIPWVAISAKSGQGVEELLDLILLVAEVEELTGDPSANAGGWVIEAHRDQKRGMEATLIITDGALKSGMGVLAGRAVAPVRIMEDFAGKAIRDASFSTPVSLIGFDELPEAGAAFASFKNKRDAEKARPAAPAPLASTEETAQEGLFVLPIIVRADSVGSLEALRQEIAKLGDEHSRIHIVQSGIGALSEGDVKTALAGSATAVMIGFNAQIDPVAEALARQHGVRVELFDIIYKLTEKLEKILQASRPERTVETVVGRARLLKLFSSRRDTYVVGGKVTEGYLAKRSTVRVTRRDGVVGEGWIDNIQTNKQNADRVDEGGEFGAQIESDFELAEGDRLECIVRSKV